MRTRLSIVNNGRILRAIDREPVEENLEKKGELVEKAEEQEAPQTARILQQAFSLPYAIQKRSFRIQLGNLVQSTAELFNEAGDILLMLVLYR